MASKGNGACYKLSLIDDFSRKVWVYFLKENIQVLLILSNGRP